MNHLQPFTADCLSPLQVELEQALHEEAMFSGTTIGDVASARASTLAQRLEEERYRGRGALPVSQGRHEAWEAYFSQLKL